MFAAVTHIKRMFGPALRVWILVTAALVFGQMNAVAHAHDHHDDMPGPTSCDICLLAVSEDDHDGVHADAEPDRIDPPTYIIPTTRRFAVAGPVPSFRPERASSDQYDNVGHPPNASRAPPL